ncbi:MAG: hypothetical protein GX610_06130 [Rhodococcus sp.]|nr:hypothetical protein [Rhodococcus sp. (in: high G+C Gram-positive bacteria)]
MTDNESAAPDELVTSAWLLIGLFGTEDGTLELADGRLAFAGRNGTRFNVAIGDVRHVEFPWYYFGGGVQFTVNGRRYRFSFVVPTGEGGRIGDVPDGRRVGAMWRDAFTAAGLLRRR